MQRRWILCILPITKRSVQCGPVAFVGDDQFIEDGFRHRSAGHRFRQGDGLPQFLVTALNRASTTSFSTATCCSINPFWNDGIFPIASGSGPLTPTGQGTSTIAVSSKLAMAPLFSTINSIRSWVLKAMAQARSTIKVAWAPAWKCAPSAVPRRVISGPYQRPLFRVRPSPRWPA